jgi:hypothetical protein
MRPVALALALSLSTAGCSHNHQLSNKQVAIGVISAAAIVGLIVLLSYGQCNELTDVCHH